MTGMEPITIRFGGYKGQNSIHTEAARTFGAALKQSLGDRIRFELIPSVLDLGHQSGDLLPMMERGELTCCYIGTIRFSDIIPEFQLFELPFFIQDRAKLYRALDGDFGNTVKEKMHAQTPFRVLGLWDNGIRHLTNKVRPIRTPEDCQGLRIRLQLSEFLENAFCALGFEPCSMDIKEFLDTVATGDVDAQENPLAVIRDFGLQQHHPYLTLSGHICGVIQHLCNADIYNSWPADVQRAVDEAARKATRVQRALALAEDDQVLAELEAGDAEIVRLTDEERAAFIEKVSPLFDAYKKKFGLPIFDALS